MYFVRIEVGLLEQRHVEDICLGEAGCLGGSIIESRRKIPLVRSLKLCSKEESCVKCTYVIASRGSHDIHPRTIEGQGCSGALVRRCTE
jgi:hypothetical protein